MMKFLRNNIFAMVVAALVVSGIAYGAVIPGAMAIWRAKTIGFAAGSTGALLSAVTDTGSEQSITTGITALGQPSRITATTAGTGGDIKDIQVTIAGLDPIGTSITEVLPIFTENSASTVTGTKLFIKVTTITLPAHDGTGATTSFSYAGSPQETQTNTVMGALTAVAADVTVTTTATTTVNRFDVPRNITATAGGTSGDIKAIQVTITGKNVEGVIITENLPAFTVNTAGDVAGSKMFASVDKIEIPQHDGTSATTSIGVGNKLGLDVRLTRNTVQKAYLGNTLEGTDPTVVTNASDIESNSATLNTTLDNTQVIFHYIETPQ